MIRPDHLLLFASRSTRVALCDSRGVSTIPLTIAPEHRTTFLRASQRRHTTKPSRRWQPPRVTSTADLQLDHLVPTLAISQCNALESLTHLANLICSNTSELEGFQALSHKDIKSPRCSTPQNGRPLPLFIVGSPKVAVTSKTRRNRVSADCPPHRDRAVHH